MADKDLDYSKVDKDGNHLTQFKANPSKTSWL